MIVSCPSCSTRYRHHEETLEPPSTGRCSRCDEEFPLVQARRSYVLMPCPSIGMDDPLLADKIRRTSPEGEPALGDAMTYDAPADEAAQDAGQAGAEASGSPDEPSGLQTMGPLVLLAAAAGAAAYYSAVNDDVTMAKALGIAAGVILVAGWTWWRWVVRKR